MLIYIAYFNIAYTNLFCIENKEKLAGNDHNKGTYYLSRPRRFEDNYFVDAESDVVFLARSFLAKLESEFPQL